MTFPDPGTLDALRRVSTATITTRLLARGLRRTFLDGLAPANPAACRMVGEAYTLRYIPAREDLDVLSVYGNDDHPQRRAVEQVPPGAVLVIDCRGRTDAAALGHILATRMRVRGVAGVVTDGALRDSPGIRTLDLPVFAAGVCATTNLARHHAVDLQVPIGCAEVAVYPGDVMVGDAEGVVCVPRELAAELAAEALDQERLEEFLLSKVESGAPLRGTYPPDPATLAEYERDRSR